MTSEEIRIDFLKTSPFALVICADKDYSEPTVSWLTGPFWTWLQESRRILGLVTAYSRKNDCDNYSRAYAQGASECHALTPAGQQEGLAVGEFFYFSEKLGSHAIIAGYENGVRFYIEPQTGQLMTLTAQEVGSCLFARF